MSKKVNKHYKYNGDTTEFLFESDEEKAFLNNAIKKRKSKPYKNILLNSFIMSSVLIAMCLSINYYQKILLENLSASASIKEKVPDVNYVEKMNSSSNTLKKTENNYFNKYEIIINKNNPIAEDMIKSYTLVNVENNLYKNIKLEEETYQSYLKLKDNLLQRNYYINIRNGFRTFEDSSNIYDTYVIEKGQSYADNYVAKPGVSEHNTGLAFDFVLSNNKNSTKTNYQSEEYNYLENIAYLYGFIIRYPKGKETITGYSYEPWHLRYVGKNLAKYLKYNNLTLEEYYETKE